MIYIDPSLDVVIACPPSESVVPTNLVHTFVPSDEYFVTKISLFPALVSPSKSPRVYPVIKIDPSLAVATP